MEMVMDMMVEMMIIVRIISNWINVKKNLMYNPKIYCNIKKHTRQIKWLNNLSMLNMVRQKVIILPKVHQRNYNKNNINLKNLINNNKVSNTNQLLKLNIKINLYSRLKKIMRMLRHLILSRKNTKDWWIIKTDKISNWKVYRKTFWKISMIHFKNK